MISFSKAKSSILACVTRPLGLLARGQTIAQQRGWEPISALQYQYSLVSRDLELEVIPCAKALGISMNAYSPLGGGTLTGKYTRGKTDAKRRFDNPMWAAIKGPMEKEYEIARKVDKVADKLGVSSAAVALAWVKQRGVLPIVGARKLSHIQENLKFLELTLPEEDMDALTAISEPELPWTYKLLHGNTGIRNLAAGGMLDYIDNDGFPY